MNVRTVVERRCRCGHPAHPTYGGICEDCWAECQPKEEHRATVAVPAKARKLIGRELGGLYYWIIDDGAIDTIPEIARPPLLSLPDDDNPLL